MKTIKNDMMELELSELEDYCGGDAFDVYADYLNTLFAKYGLRGIRAVKQVCTPEELARIKELYHAFLYADDVA